MESRNGSSLISALYIRNLSLTSKWDANKLGSNTFGWKFPIINIDISGNGGGVHAGCVTLLLWQALYIILPSTSSVLHTFVCSQPSGTDPCQLNNYSYSHLCSWMYALLEEGVLAWRRLWLCVASIHICPSRYLLPVWRTRTTKTSIKAQHFSSLCSTKQSVICTDCAANHPPADW